MSVTSNNGISLSSQVYFYPDQNCIKNKLSGHKVYLTPSEKKLLDVILDGKGSKENIIHEIWLKNGTIVGESSYHQLIKMLRGKLKSAGLPCSMIKTIPRHGVIFISEHEVTGINNQEAHAYVLPRPEDDESPITPIGNAETLCNDKPISDDVDVDVNTLYLREVESVEHASNDIVNKKKKTFILPKKIAFLVLLVIIFSPMAYFIFNGATTTSFPLNENVEGVNFHSFTVEQLSSKNLNKIFHSLDKETHEVYIASNGPKIWIAKCNKSINQKDSQCQYEYLSAY